MAQLSKSDYIAAAAKAKADSLDKAGFLALLPGVKEDTAKQTLYMIGRQFAAMVEHRRPCKMEGGKPTPIEGRTLEAPQVEKADKINRLISDVRQSYWGATGTRGRKPENVENLLDSLDI